MTPTDRARAAVNAICSRQSKPIAFQNLDALAAALEETDKWNVSRDELIVRAVLAYNAWVDRDLAETLAILRNAEVSR